MSITTTDSTAANAVYSQYRVTGDTAIFKGPSASDKVEESLTLKSIAPKRGNGQFGNRRSTANFATGTAVTDLEGNDVIRARKLAVEASLPVGTLELDFVNDCAKLSSLLLDATFVKSLFLAGVIEH